MRRARKTVQRLEVIDEIANTLKTNEIYEVIIAGKMTEAQLRQFTYPFLSFALKRVFRRRKPHVSDKTINRNAEKALVWGGAKGRSIHALKLLGVKHIPDFEINLPSTTIGIEFKRGKSGQSLRNGFGQALVYSQKYDFVIYLYVDVSENRKTLAAMKGKTAQDFLGSLWEHYNIRFVVA